MDVNKNVDINIKESTPRNSVIPDIDTSTGNDNQKDIAIIDIPHENSGTNHKQNNAKSREGITYGIEDNPPIHLGLLLGLQVRKSCFVYLMRFNYIYFYFHLYFT